jgi:hypothetical protein
LVSGELELVVAVLQQHHASRQIANRKEEREAEGSSAGWQGRRRPRREPFVAPCFGVLIP